MAQFQKDLTTWNNNIFFDNQAFSNLQMSLVPIQLYHGSYQIYQTQITPPNQSEYQHIFLLPGTAFKFSNKLNAQYTSKSLLNILTLKNFPTKIYVISHRINPVFNQALTDAIQMIQIILKKQKIVNATILTLSGGCTYLKQISDRMNELKCQTQKIIMVSPVVDLTNKQRPIAKDFLNKDFFQFFEKVYCGGDNQKVRKLSLIENINQQSKQNLFVKTPITILYGSEEYIKDDIEQFIKVLNQIKLKWNKNSIYVKCIQGQDHALFSFVTSRQTRANEQAMRNIAQVKWQASKYIADVISEKIE